jgi:hypothetical protein
LSWPTVPNGAIDRQSDFPELANTKRAARKQKPPPEKESPGAADTATGADQISEDDNNTPTKNQHPPQCVPASAEEQEFRETWRVVANAKLTEYRRQCWRLSGLVRTGTVRKQAAVDHLWTVATGHALVRALGEDRVEYIIGEAFTATDFHPMHAEVA